MQRLGADRVESVGPAAAHLRVGAREVERVEHGPHVERRAADEDRHGVAAADLSIAARAHCWNAATLASWRRLEHVEQVVRDPAALGLGGLGAAHVHARGTAAPSRR